MKCFEMDIHKFSMIPDMQLTVNMKCFEITWLNNRNENLARLTINMKCFEIELSQYYLRLFLINRKHEMF